MKFQRSTLILVGAAFLLGAGVLIAESQRSQSPTSTAETASTAPVFTFAETDVATLTVDRGSETLVFEQDDEANWQMLEPENALAEPGAIAFLLSRLNTDSPLQTVTMQADQATDFGFNAPVGIVTVTLNDGTEHELILGGPDFSGSANYAVIDPDPWPPAAGTEYSVLVVTRDVANGINRPREEWLMPVETLAPEAGAEDAAIPDDGETPENPVDLEAAPESPAEPAAPENDGETTN
ncbi:MAG: hypothetical protein DCF17_14070 [Shackletoniella antarctica]|uniref:DUF4340 domain-containing protein n=1 Tax=Shackletoniella antarctica TaxID=268115 RepID=A0A2W4W381_9CYAN|nr:MAG: hypothetical protein DCF17_14070 [Shackletoniella antarctica]